MRVVSGLMFYPRGGSAHVTRALAQALPAHGWDVTVVSGSLPGGTTDARRFFAGLDVRPVDFAAGDAPLHPSYEDREGVADRCFARVGDAEYERHVEAWARALAGAGAARADVLHLHHLTPLHEAARRVARDVPVVGHLHGTELLMLEAIAAGPPAAWEHSRAWAERMRRWARRCRVLLVPAAAQVERAVALLGVARERCVVVPNGVDPEAFQPAAVDRGAVWRRLLPDHAERLLAGPIVLSVGRFTAVKRHGLLVRAFVRARERTRSGSLVIVGGHPGEVEGEHPADAIRATGTRDVHLAGWHDHAELPEILNAADALALASVQEQFGLVLVEAMACGRPVVAVDRGGPRDIVTPGRTGWLVPPDDEAAMADALVAVLEDPGERTRRGRHARGDAVGRWGWDAVAERVGEALERAAAPTMIEDLKHSGYPRADGGSTGTG